MSEYVSTAEAAAILGVKEKTLRNNASKRGAYYGVAPVKNQENGRLMWPREEIERLAAALRKDVERALEESKLNRLPVSAILPPEAVWLLTNAAKKDRLAADPEDPYRKATHVDKALAIVRARWPQFFRQPEAKE